MLVAAPYASADTREIRAIDGSNNNLAHPDWGTPGSHLLREASGTHYADGISTLIDRGPSARAVSNAFFPQAGAVGNHLGQSDYMWVFGQLLDHDFSLTEGNGSDGLTDSFIKIPTFDPFFDPFGTGTQVMSFHRGFFDLNTGTTTPRKQINEITGYIDGSNVYGSDAQRAAWLRSGVGGKLKVTHTSLGDLLPFNDGTIGNAGTPERPDLSTTLFVAGDIRSNETVTLAVMHTLFVREHNRLAAFFASQHPSWTDEQVYQAARRVNIAELQHIVIDEFVPALFGNAAGIGPYAGYDPTVNAGVSAVFSTSAYRVGHTFLSPEVQRLDANGNSIGAIKLRDLFFAATPPQLTSVGIEPFLRGAAAQEAQELDNKVIDEVRNFLFGVPGSGGLDLISLNVQRGRDLGLPDFNTIRADFGLPRFTKFSQITKNTTLASALRQLYGSIDNIDAFAGMFVEDHASGFDVGSTLLAVYTNQFKRSRAGDRFWWEKSGVLTSDERDFVRSTELADVIKRNTPIRAIQGDAFFVPGSSQPIADPGL